MRTILCYGDSNTWGAIPGLDSDRYGRDVRWPGRLQAILGEDFWVVEEGLSGRTTVWDDPIEGGKNGKDYLIPCLESHTPLDLVVLLLGTNDLKKRFSLTAFDIAQGTGTLIRMIQASMTGTEFNSPQILLICPPPLGHFSFYADMFEGGQEKSKKLAAHYALVADEYGCSFLDAGQVIKSSDLDGIHFEADQHALLAQAVAEIILEIFSE